LSEIDARVALEWRELKFIETGRLERLEPTLFNEPESMDICAVEGKLRRPVSGSTTLMFLSPYSCRNSERDIDDVGDWECRTASSRDRLRCNEGVETPGVETSD
jgi:hypothetical protein